MNKKIVLIITGAVVLAAITILLIVLGVTGVFTPKEKAIRLTEIAGFEKLILPADSIVVDFYGSPDDAIFTVSDRGQIEEIHKRLSEHFYTKIKNEKDHLPFPGSNLSLTFHYDDNTEIYMNIYYIRDKDGFLYSNSGENTLDDYLSELKILIQG